MCSLRVLGSLQGKLQSNSQASCHVLSMHAPFGPRHIACEARYFTTLAIRLRIALDPTSLRFFMNNPYLAVCRT